MNFSLLYEELSGKDGLDCGTCKIGCCPNLERQGIYLLFLPGELSHLKETGLMLSANIKTFVGTNGHIVEYLENCPHLLSNRCTIHDNRPVDCRTFPLMPKLIDSKWLTVNISQYPCPQKSNVLMSYKHRVASAWESIYEDNQEWFVAVQELDKVLINERV